MDADRVTRHPFITAALAFQRYPGIGTIEHLTSRVDPDGVRRFDAQAVRDTMQREVPDDLTCCDECGGETVIVEVCEAGYAVYCCARCSRRFRVVCEHEYYFQEVQI